MSLRSIIKLFESGNVCVTGLRGRGKDMLFANVVIRRKSPYVSNIDYGGQFFPFDADKLNVGGNTYKEFISGNVKKYVYPYGDGTDIYTSDVGVYYPSQYCSELNKMYPSMPNFMALSRQIGLCNWHINTQNLNRCWDKIREQSDIYLYCMWCKVLFGKIVFQCVREYEKYESCVNRVPPFRIKAPILSSPGTKATIDMQKELYECSHGRIRTHFLIYYNRSNYNTRHFKEVLANGK